MTNCTKTLRVRIKDKHAKVLSQFAFEVNHVWKWKLNPVLGINPLA
jgi:hypothetical protein